MTTSRFVRPATPSRPLWLQPRDTDVLRRLTEYRLLYARHLRTFVFGESSIRRVQARLRLLWEHRLLNRYFRPVLFDGTRPVIIEPAYGLGPATANMVIGSDVLGTPREPSPMTFDHEIAVADCLTAITAACRSRTDVTLVSATPATPLWRRLHTSNAKAPFLVPDGAVTFRHQDGTVRTFYIEIVRADVKGGNERLARKMREYAHLNREGRFSDLYGHDQLRAVLFLTTSDERAEHFRALTAQVPHGRRLFWFGSYQAKGPNGRDVSALTPDTILSPRWRMADGTLASLIEPSHA